MRSKLNILITLILVLLISITNAQAQERTNTLTQQETQDAKALLLKMLNRLEETKDFAVIADEFFTPEFPFCCQCAESEDGSEEDASTDLANSKQADAIKDKYIL